jgi:hypothetical protein
MGVEPSAVVDLPLLRVNGIEDLCRRPLDQATTQRVYAQALTIMIGEKGAR